jgi:WD40 repeat protein/tetratricopeptide (TPR) repeat protein
MQEDKRETSLEVNNEKALQQLAWAIENSAGKFKLILARCNYASLRSRLISRLKEICPVEISVLQLRESGRTLFAAIGEEFGEDLPAALMVLGLDSVERLPQMLTAVNQVREEFRKHFTFPLVLWINDDIYKQLMQFAPDFESWATSKSFVIQKDELGNHFRDIANLWFSNNLRLGEDDYLILKLELEAAQRDLLGVEDVSSSKISNWELEADLESLLGFVEKNNNQKDAALEHYQKALSLWRQVDNVGIKLGDELNENKLERQVKILGEICICYYLKAIKHADKNHLNWQATKNYIQEYLGLVENNQRLDLINHDSVIFGEILRDLQEWKVLKKIFSQLLETHRVENKPLELARDYGFLAEAALGEKNWRDANSYARQALDLIKDLPVSSFPGSSLEMTSSEALPLVRESRQSLGESVPTQSMGTRENSKPLSLQERGLERGLYLCILAKSQYYLGEKLEAIRNLEIARELSEPLEDVRLYIDILNYLQKLYFEQKEYLKAYDIKQEQFSVEQQFGLRAFIGAGRLQSFKGDGFSTEDNRNIKNTKYHEKVAPEIAASTRQLDVERLVERVGDTQHKLIVIYGQSGVGKSSLVNGGLEPALKNKAIGIKDNLPLVVRVYTNWQEELARQIEENLSPNLSPARREALISPPFLARETSISPPSLAGKGVGGLGSAIFEKLTEIEQCNIRTVLIFDQFEEFFFVCTEPEQRREFFGFLADCLNVLSVKVILSLRVDYLHYLLECNDLPNMNIIGNDILSNNVLYKVGNFKPDDAKSIIQRLTEGANFPLEPALVDKLVEDLAGTLGEVRPIELQIVGAQLQAENINNLAKYGLLGEKAKEELVKRYLQAVVENCGAENMQVAELLLYSLTDDKGTRPLKTRAELERDLEEITPSGLSRNLSEFQGDLKSSQFDLVLKILVKSGLVLLLPEKPGNRYQLVHDYIAAFIHQQQEPKLTVLMEELQIEREQRKVSEEKLNQFLKRALTGSIAAGFGLAVLAVTAAYQALETNKQKQQADIQKQQADINAVEAQIKSSEALFNSGKIRDASIAALQAGETLKEGKGKTVSNQILTTMALQQAIYSNYPVTELQTLTGHTDGINCIAWSRDGKTLASASDDKTIKLWDVTTGREIKTLNEHNDSVNCIAWSRDGNTLASASDDKTIKLWDVTTGREIKTLIGHNDSVNCITWSRDGNTLASASDDKTIKLWDVTTGREIKTLIGHNNTVNCIAWSSDGKTLASASWDNTIKLWDVTTGREIKTLTGHTQGVFSITWSADGKTLASASDDKTIKIWDVVTGQLSETIDGHEDRVIAIAWNHNDKILISAGNDKKIKIWDVTTAREKFLIGHSLEVFGVAWSADGKTLASTSWDKTIKIWDVNTGKLLKTLTGHLSGIDAVAWNSNSKTLASASQDQTIKIWDVVKGQALKTVNGHSDKVSDVAWSPDNKTLASASWDRTIKLWDVNTGKKIKTLIGHNNKINSVVWSSDGNTLASASWDKTIQLWDANTGKKIKTLTAHSDVVKALSWKDDDKILASASWDDTIKLWDTSTGKLIRTLTGHNYNVTSVAWNPDGTILASASKDKTIKLWDATTGKLLKTLTGHSLGVNSIAWSADGKTLASASGDKTVILWDLDFENLVKSACSRLENYLPFHAEVLADLKSCQSPSLLARAAEVLVVQGEELARNGDTESAVTKFQQAQKWNPQLKFDPETKAREFQKEYK